MQDGLDTLVEQRRLAVLTFTGSQYDKTCNTPADAPYNAATPRHKLTYTQDPQFPVFTAVSVHLTLRLGPSGGLVVRYVPLGQTANILVLVRRRVA